MKLSELDDMQRARAEFKQLVDFELALQEWGTSGTGRVSITVRDQNDGAGATFEGKFPRNYNLPDMREGLRLLVQKYRKQVQARLMLYGIDDFGRLPKE